MCLGIPMQVIEGGDMSALCVRGDETRRVSLLLTGAQRPGTHLLVHIDTAIRVLDEEEAGLIENALQGLAAALRGENCDEHFADLLGREPELPAHLR